MPTGKPLAYMMDNEVVEVLYTCVKCAQNNIDFDEAARLLGLKNATSAKDRLARVMKAQKKDGGGGGPSAPGTVAKTQKTAGAKRGRKAKDADGANDGGEGNDTMSSSKKPKLGNGHVDNGDAEVNKEADAGVEGTGQEVEKNKDEVEEPVVEV